MSLDKRLFKEMKVFEVNTLAFRQKELGRNVILLSFCCVFLQRIIVTFVEVYKLIMCHFERARQFDCDFLLFKENELVVLHVLLRVSFQV